MFTSRLPRELKRYYILFLLLVEFRFEKTNQDNQITLFKTEVFFKHRKSYSKFKYKII